MYIIMSGFANDAAAKAMEEAHMRDQAEEEKKARTRLPGSRSVHLGSGERRALAKSSPPGGVQSQYGHIGGARRKSRKPRKTRKSRKSRRY